MINIGDLEIAGVYIGDTELSVYAGDELLYPLNFGTLTGISLDNLTWVTDVPANGGTATSANCSYTVTGYYDSGKTRKLTSKSTITGYLDVPATTADTREMVGTLTLTASYSGFTDSDTVDVYQEANYVDYSTMYLTFKIKGNGNIRWMHTNNSYTRTIQYSKDNGATWNSVTSTKGSESDDSGGTKISVSTGDIVLFKGSNSSYGTGNYYISFERTYVECEVYGNIMSLVCGDDFVDKTLSAGTHNFRNIFSFASGITSVENLILPTTTTPDCYEWGFQNCIFPKAPKLPATTLASRCYRRMFRNNPNLNYVNCLATSGINTTNTENWLANVASSGTFIKKSGVSWSTGENGIPNNWTVQEV